MPLSLQKEVDDGLRRMEDLGVIMALNYSDWTARLVIVPKTNGEVHICGDFKLTFLGQFWLLIMVAHSK